MKDRRKERKERSLEKMLVHVSDIKDPETKRLAEEYIADSCKYPLEHMLQSGDGREEIKEAVRICRNTEDTMTRYEFQTSFQGYILAKKNVRGHALGESLSIFYRKSRKKLSQGKFNPMNDPLLNAIYGYQLAFPDKKRDSAIKECAKAVISVTLDARSP